MSFRFSIRYSAEAGDVGPGPPGPALLARKILAEAYSC